MTAQILVIDDSNVLREWLARLLKQHGYIVTQAASGEEALTLLRQTGAQRPPFDVVITDIVMGEVDGVEVTRAARSHPAPPEVILLTSHGDLATATAAVRLGAYDYLLKPARSALLLERVAAAAEQRQEQLRQASEAAAWRAVADVVRQIRPGTVAADATPATPPPARYRTIGQIEIDTQRREVRYDGAIIALTPIEYTILNVLAETPAAVVTYSDLAQHTHAATLNEREAYALLRTHVRNLRRKIDPDYLVSVRGIGYMLDTPKLLEVAVGAD